MPVSNMGGRPSSETAPAAHPAAIPTGNLETFHGEVKSSEKAVRVFKPDGCRPAIAALPRKRPCIRFFCASGERVRFPVAKMRVSRFFVDDRCQPGDVTMICDL